MAKIATTNRKNKIPDNKKIKLNIETTLTTFNFYFVVRCAKRTILCCVFCDFSFVQYFLQSVSLVLVS